MQKYYYTTGGDDKPIGPVSFDELRTLAAEGKIHGNTPVIREGAEEWGRFKEFQAGEVVERVTERAARVVAAFQTRESQTFALGFLISAIRFLTLPWDIVANSIRVASDWGAARFIAVPADRLTSATLGKVGAPVIILLWTVFWLGDAVCMLIVGRPSFLLSLASIVVNFITMGISVSGDADLSQRMATGAAKGALTAIFTVQNFGDRLGWAIKIGTTGYFFTIFWALIGEAFSGLAALIGLRGEFKRGVT
jgi:hypothetical protein